MTLVFFMILYDQFKAPYQVVLVFDIFCIFLEFSLSKKANKWSDVSQLAYDVESHSNQAWMPTMGMPTFLKKLGSFEGCQKIDHVQRRVCRYGRRVRLKARCFSTSVKWPQKFSTSFYGQFKPQCQVVFVFDKFRIPWSFLGKKTDKWMGVL
jgi:hypothetical protein